MTDTNKVVVITGVAGGIGSAAAKMYYEKGVDVIGIDRTAVIADYRTMVCDIRDEEQIEKCFQIIQKEYRHIDYLINVAGVFYCGDRNTIDNMVVEQWEDTLRNNLTGTMMVIKKAIPLLRAAPEDKAIINISSDQARHPRARNASYAVSKGGIEVLTRISAQELLADRIRVNGIAPVSVRTPFIRDLAGDETRMKTIFETQEKLLPLGILEAEDVAELIFFLGSKQSKKITGQIIQIDSGLYI